MALFIVVGVVAGFIIDRYAPKVYRSEAIIRSNNLSINIVVGQIEKLNNLCKIKNYHELSSQLNISELEAEKISSIQVYYGLLTRNDLLRHSEQPMHYVRKYSWDDTSLIASKFAKIVVEVLDENVYADLTPGLLHFISNNTFGHRLNTLRVEQLKSQIAYTEKEIATLQQIQSTSTSKNNASVQLELSGALQKSEQVQLHETINSLYQLKIELEREYMLFTQPTTVISDFSKAYTPTVGLYDHIGRAVLAIAVLGFAALLLWDNRKKRLHLQQK
ncbi:MAG: hypothetical protein LBO71_07470 [Prevotellaceae bacterium]|nr:hypothetical protein [Prevotellaceae bacterium]